jgi:ABC-type tungstate transport system substrate-binding protein
MHLMRESWTDARLDDFVVHVDKQFKAVDKRFDSVDRRLDSIEADLKGMQRVMIQAAIALTSAFIAGFAAMIGVIATRL